MDDDANDLATPEADGEAVAVTEPVPGATSTVAAAPDEVEVATDEEGNGAAFVGIDADNVTAVEAGSGEATFGPSHTIGITRVAVEGGPANGSVTVHVTTR